MPWFL